MLIVLMRTNISIPIRMSATFFATLPSEMGLTPAVSQMQTPHRAKQGQGSLLVGRKEKKNSDKVPPLFKKKQKLNSCETVENLPTECCFWKFVMLLQVPSALASYKSPSWPSAALNS